MKSPSQQIVFLRYKWDVLVLILLLPLIAINFNGFHDAGDDFAQYLLQAKWLTGNQQAWYPDHTGNYSPGIKGWLFSVLLIPATWCSHPTDILVSKFMVTLFLLLTGWVFFRILYNFLPALAAIGCTLFLVYNPMMLDLKNQILPDIPMMATFLLAFYLLFFQKSTTIVLTISIVVIWLSTGLKTPGLLLLVPVIGWAATTTFPGRFKFLFASLAGMLLILVIEFILGKASNGPVWYLQQTVDAINPDILLMNVTTYFQSLQLIPQLELPMWINKAIWILLCIGWLMGVVWSFFPEKESHRNLKSKYFERFILLFQLCLILMLLVYPYKGDPVRMLLPIFPFFLITTFKGFTASLERLNFPNQKTVFVLAGMLLPVLMIPSMLKLQTKNQEARKAATANLNMAQFLKSATEPNERLKSNKPWAVQYYTKRITMPLSDSQVFDWIVILRSDHSKDPGNISNNRIVYQNDFWMVYNAKP